MIRFPGGVAAAAQRTDMVDNAGALDVDVDVEAGTGAGYRVVVDDQALPLSALCCKGSALRRRFDTIGASPRAGHRKHLHALHPMVDGTLW